MRHVTTNIVGGLGNQLFLTANLIATAKRSEAAPWIVREEWSSSCAEPRPTYWSSMLRGVEAAAHPPAGFTEASVSTVVEQRPVGKITVSAPHTRLVGFFQSSVFFDDAIDDVRRQVVPVDIMAAASRRLQVLNPTRLPCVAVHVRRGDYLTMPDVFCQLPHDYYTAALRQLYGSLLFTRASQRPGAQELPGHFGAVRGYAPAVRVLVFTEDSKYGEALCGLLSTTFPSAFPVLVGGPSEPAGHDVQCTVPSDVADLCLMAQCNDVVMANSSYSWWGAFLNEQPHARVVAPSQWFVQDPFPHSAQLYHPGWVVL